jgi:hypothetical protein
MVGGVSVDWTARYSEAERMAIAAEAGLNGHKAAEESDGDTQGHPVPEVSPRNTPSEQARGQQGQQDSAEVDLLAGLRDGAWLDVQDFPPLTYAVPGLIPEGSVLLIGAPKIGKSWLVLTIALAAASGGRALGIKVDPRPSLYLALEDGDRRMQDRCRRLLATGPIPAAFHYLTRAEPGRVIDTVAAWLQRQHDAAPLVILDTLGKVMPPAQAGESAYQRDYRIGGWLRQLADSQPGMTMLTNHHDRKAESGDFVDQVSGTNGLAGAADTIIVITRDRNESGGLLKVTGRDVPEGEYAVCFEEGHRWRLDGDDLAEAAKRARDLRATAGLGDRSADVVRYVGEHPDGVTAGDVAEALDMERNAARVYLSRLVDAGRLNRPRRGTYTPVASVASVASEEGDPPGTQQRNTRNTPRETPQERRRRLVDGIALIAGNSPQDLADAERLVSEAPDLAELIDPTGDTPWPTPWGDEAPLAWATAEARRRQAGGDR